MKIDHSAGLHFFRKSYNEAKKILTPIDSIDKYENYIIGMDDISGSKNIAVSMSTMTGRILFDDNYARDFLNNMPINNILVSVLTSKGVINYSFINLGDRLYTEREGYNGSSEHNILDNVVVFEMYHIVKKISENKIYCYMENVEYKRKRDGRLMTNKIVLFSLDRKRVSYPFTEVNKIDWKHSWSVVGHWRAVERIGKNRHGEYCEIGRTWVNPCLKGNGDFIKKTRMAA